MKNLDKYVEYVIAQVGEGGHTRDEMVQDLKERGLNDNEIENVLNLAWAEGQEIEDEIKGASILNIVLSMGIPVIIVVLLLIDGRNLLSIRSLWYIFFGIIAVIIVLFRKQRFK